MQITPNAAKHIMSFQTVYAPPCHSVARKNYLFPIPEDQVKKAPNLRQNPGWELSEAKPDDTPNEGEKLRACQNSKVTIKLSAVGGNASVHIYKASE